MWVILELNFICFVSILSQELRIINRNGNLYYFLIQSLGRALILLRIMVFIVWKIEVFYYIFFISILLKLGGVPFQFWYLKLIQKINWLNIWLLSIWQKLIPLVLIRFSNKIFLIFFSLLGVVFRSLRRIKQKKIKKILGLSSLFSLGWILSVIWFSKAWLWFIIGYGIALIILILNLKKVNLTNVENLENSLINPLDLLIFFLNLLILRGIPPFIIFYLKILILFYLIKLRVSFIIIFLIMRILIIYIYLIILFSVITFLKLKETSRKAISLKKIEFRPIILQIIIFAFLIITFI